MLERAPPDLAPIGKELILRRRHGIWEELQDVLARHADVRLLASALVRGPRRGRRGRPLRRGLRLSQILAQALEYGFTQEAVIGDAAELNFRLNLGPDPSGFGLLHRLGKGRSAQDQRIEFLAKLARDHVRVAAPHLPRIEQAPAVPAANI